MYKNLIEFVRETRLSCMLSEMIDECRMGRLIPTIIRQKYRKYTSSFHYVQTVHPVQPVTFKIFLNKLWISSWLFDIKSFGIINNFQINYAGATSFYQNCALIYKIISAKSQPCDIKNEFLTILWFKIIKNNV